MPPLSNEQNVFYQELVHEYSGRIYRLAYRLTGNSEVARDLSQETFCEAWKSLSQLREVSRVKSWLFSILRHRYQRWLRLQVRSKTVPLEPLDLSDLKEAEQPTTPHVERDQVLQLALQALDPRLKESFLLVFLDGWSCREVAEQQKLPLGTVLSRVHRARTFLREFLACAEAEEEIAMNSSLSGKVIQWTAKKRFMKR